MAKKEEVDITLVIGLWITDYGKITGVTTLVVFISE